MTGLIATTEYSTFTDDRLLDLLLTEADRLPRAAVDAFLARGDRMIELLTAVLQSESAWNENDDLFWRPVHATYILGAIGGEKSVPGLMAALRHSTHPDFEHDWVFDRLPSIFGTVGLPAVDPLLSRFKEAGRDSLERTMILSSLRSIAAREPSCRDELLDLFRAVAESETEPPDLRGWAASHLCDFARPGDRAAAAVAARVQEEAGFPILVAADVDDAYANPRPLRINAPLEWLSFYGPEAIAARQDRWRQDWERDRWKVENALQEPGNAAEIRAILERYRATLDGLSEPVRRSAVETASQMIEFRVAARRPPWSWDLALLREFLDPRTVEPQEALRFLRHWKSEGRDLDSLARAMESELEWKRKREEAPRPAEIEKPTPFVGVAQPGRNDHCPCGSGKKYKKCCEGP